MSKNLATLILVSATFLTPFNHAYADEQSGKACSLLTDVDDAGEIIWSSNADAAALVADAQSLEISPADYKALCAGEEIVQEAASEEAPEEDATEGEQESTEVASEDVDVEVEPKESIMSSAGVIAPLAGLGLAAGGGGGGGSSSSSSTSYDRTGGGLSDSSTFSYNSSLDSTWTARQEYKNVGHYHSASSINPYTLIGVNYAYGMGLSGSGKTIAIHDTQWKNSAGTMPYEFNGKTITYHDAANLTTGGSDSTRYHGLHVAGIIAANYDSNSSTYISSNTNSDWSGTTNLGSSMGYNGGSGDHSLLGYGMMGIAYDASLHISDFGYTTSGSYNLTSAAATNDAIGAIAQNNSWGFSNTSNTINAFVTYQNNNGTSDLATYVANGGDTESNWSSYVTALNDFQVSGVIVFASGNTSSADSVDAYAGMPLIFDDLAEAWLTVGNLDVSGSTVDSSSVTRYSNPCGIAAKFCIYADGTDITSSVGGYGGSSETGRYQIYDGSSMAAPMVSGSIALLSQAFPNHTPEQIVDRILATADNTFFTATGTLTFANGITHGYNTEFGQGIIDLEKALSPVTSSMVSNAMLINEGNSGNVSNARRFDIESSTMRLGGAFGDSLKAGLGGRKAYFYDALNGGFAFDMGSLITNNSSNLSTTHAFESTISGNSFKRTEMSNGMSFLSDTTASVRAEDSLMTFVPVSKSSSTFLGRNIHLQNAMSFTNREDNFLLGLHSDSVFNVPFMQASEQGSSFGVRSQIGSGQLSLGLFEGESKDYKINTSGFVSDYGREIGSSHLSFFAGVTKEVDGFLETSVEGAFAEESKAETTFAGVASYGWLGSSWSYNSMGSLGSTKLDVTGVGLLSDIDNVISSVFAIEAARPIGLSEKDSFHIGLSQPMRVESGEATIKLPQLYDTGGNLNFEQTSVELAPSGRQLDMTVGYQNNLWDSLKLGFGATMSKDYGHIKSDDYIASVKTFLSLKL